MTTGIDQFTDGQWDEVYLARDHWLARGMSTDRADRVTVEAAMTRLYAAKGYKRPIMVWADSPMAAVLMAAMFCGQLGDQLRDQLDGQLRDQLQQIYFNTRCSGWGMAWYAFWSILRDLGHITYPTGPSALLDDFAAVTYGATSWTPYIDVCLLSERPTYIGMVGRYDQARLHRADGPAIEFADGWTVHAWQGVRVPAWVIDNPTPDLIQAEPNVEIRRCAIEHLGWETYIEQAGLELGPAAADPGNPGQQLRLSQPLNIFGIGENQQVRVLICVNGTVERGGIRRRFGLTTPTHISDPVEAAAWTYGLPVDTYRTLQRRT